jgi:hypothetical protein
MTTGSSGGVICPGKGLVAVGRSRLAWNVGCICIDEGRSRVTTSGLFSETRSTVKGPSAT